MDLQGSFWRVDIVSGSSKKQCRHKITAKGGKLIKEAFALCWWKHKTTSNCKKRTVRANYSLVKNKRNLLQDTYNKDKVITKIYELIESIEQELLLVKELINLNKVKQC